MSGLSSSTYLTCVKSNWPISNLLIFGSDTLDSSAVVSGTLISTVSAKRSAFAGSVKKSNSMLRNKEMSSSK